MEESKLPLSPSKYRLLKLPEIDVKNRPRLKTPEKRKEMLLGPTINKKPPKILESLAISSKHDETADESTIDDIAHASRRYETNLHQKTTIPDFPILRPLNHASSNTVIGITTEISQINYPDSPVRKILAAKYLTESPTRGVVYPSIGPDLNAEPIKYQNELKDKNYYFNTFKNMDSILSKEALVNSPANVFLKECHSMQLLPYSFRMHQQSGSLKSIKINHYGIGDKYVGALAEGVAVNSNLEKLNLRENRISDLGALPLLDKVPRSIRLMDLSHNNLGFNSISKICFIITSYLYSDIAWLNLEANRLGNKSVKLLCDALKQSSKLKVLNISRNEITDDVAKDIGEAAALQRKLEQLYIHWNRIRSKGGSELLAELSDTPNLRQLDISGNRMGSDALMLSAKKLAEFIAQHKNLVHVDISNNCFEKQECEVIAEGLSKNHSIVGFHVAGNKAEVNALGFLKPLDTLDVASQVLWLRMPQPRKFFSKKMIHQKASGRCWICEGWKEVQFTWTNTDPSLVDPEPVYLHLDFDEWKGDLMLKKADNVYSSTRMCPPGKINYFFTILNETQQLGESEMIVPVDDTEKSFVNILLTCCWTLTYWEKQKAEELGILKDIKVQKLNIMDIERFDVLQHKSFDFAMECRPRPDPKIWKAKKTMMKRNPWKFESSVFKDWKFDNEAVERACFEYDWSFSKIPRLIKEESELPAVKEMLWKCYPKIRAAFRYISGISPQGNIFSIPLNSFTEFFIYKCDIIDQKTLKLPDIDRNFIATNFSDKKGLRNPAQALVRFQLMEIVVRIALDKYISNKIMTSYKDSVELFLNEIVMPYCNTFDHQKWRETRYWNEEVDRVYKFNWNFINKLFDWASAESRKRPGSKKFVSIDEFCKLCSDGGLVDIFISERDPTLLYGTSMMTVVNELENERGSQMSITEFIEALGRVADRLEDKQVPNCKGLETKLTLLLKSLSKNLFSGNIEIIDPPTIVEEWEV